MVIGTMNEESSNVERFSQDDDYYEMDDGKEEQEEVVQEDDDDDDDDDYDDDDDDEGEEEEVEVGDDEDGESWCKSNGNNISDVVAGCSMVLGYTIDAKPLPNEIFVPNLPNQNWSLPKSNHDFVKLCKAVLEEQISYSIIDYEAAEAALQSGNFSADCMADFLCDSIALGNEEAVQFFLECKACQSWVDWNDVLPGALLTAIRLGEEGCLQLLLQHGADPNGTATEHDRLVPLAYVLEHARNKFRLCQLLLEAGADPQAFANSTGESSFLHFDMDLPLLELFLECGCDPHARDTSGNTPLLESIRHGRLENVRALLAAGADVNDKNREGQSAIHRACETDDAHEILLWLVQNTNVDTTALDELGQNALHVACRFGIESTVFYLIDVLGLSPYAVNKHGQNALHAVCHNQVVCTDQVRHAEVVERLLARYPDLLHFPSPSAYSPLHLAATWSPKMCGLLIQKKYGMDLAHPTGDKFEMNALQIAIKCMLIDWTPDLDDSHVRAVLDLIPQNSNFDWNYTDKDGRTALHYLLEHKKNYVSLFCRLVQRGCNPKAVANSTFKSPLLLALKKFTSEESAKMLTTLVLDRSVLLKDIPPSYRLLLPVVSNLALRDVVQRQWKEERSDETATMPTKRPRSSRLASAKDDNHDNHGKDGENPTKRCCFPSESRSRRNQQKFR